jgi:hypothetical protein
VNLRLAIIVSSLGVALLGKDRRYLYLTARTLQACWTRMNSSRSLLSTS